MSFDQEWASLKAEAKQSVTSMRLNEAGGRAGAKNLKVSGSTLRAKAQKAEGIAKTVRDLDNEAMKETGEIKAGLKGFDSASAFDDFQERWRDQMRYLGGLLDQKLAPALRSTATLFETTDKQTGERAKREGENVKQGDKKGKKDSD